MKEIKVIPLASAFAGCFLGAGFVSGQELWQFFGEFGVKGYIGLILACVLLAAFGTVMMACCRNRASKRWRRSWCRGTYRFCGLRQG